MTFLPIVERELRAAARRKSTYRLRSWTALVAMAVGLCCLLWIWLVSGRGNLGNPLFRILTGHTFGLCLLAGVFLTADCLSEEKREGTLGLLFLTELKGYDVVLGKFIARSLPALYGLLALLPLMGIPLLLGGVTGGEFWRMALALVNALFFSLAVGIWISSLSRDSERAMTATFGLLLLMATLPMLTWVGPRVRPTSAWSCLAWVSPFFSFSYSQERMYAGHARTFWGALSASDLLAWLFVVLASWLLPRRWQAEATAREPWSMAKRWLQVGQVSRLSKGRRALEAKTVGETPGAAGETPAPLPGLFPLREKPLPANPLLRLLSRHTATPWLAWLVVVVWGVVVLAMTTLMPQQAAGFVLGWYVVRPFGFLLKVLFTFQVCRFLVEARRNGALEMLLCTPVRSRDILQAQTLALRRSFLWPSVAFLVVLFVPLGVQATNLIRTADFPGIIGLVAGWFSAAVCAVRMGADVCALYWFGLWLALTMKKPSLAPALTVLVVLVVPAALLSFCLLDILADLFFILWGATKLQQDWRWLLARQYL